MRMDRRLCFSPNSMHIWNKYNITWTNRGSLGSETTVGTNDSLIDIAPEGVYINGMNISNASGTLKSYLLSFRQRYSTYSISSDGFIELSGNTMDSAYIYAHPTYPYTYYDRLNTAPINKYTSFNNVLVKEDGSGLLQPTVKYSLFNNGIWYWKKYSGIAKGYAAITDPSLGIVGSTVFIDGSTGLELGVRVYIISSNSYTLNSNGTISLDRDASDSTSLYPYMIVHGTDNFPKHKYFRILSSSDWNSFQEVEAEGVKEDTLSYIDSNLKTNNYVYELVDSSTTTDSNNFRGYRCINPVRVRTKGSYIGLVSSDNPNKYPKDGYTNFDEYYYEFDHYGDAVKGTTYLGQVKDKNENAYPDNGLYNGYWYVKVK